MTCEKRRLYLSSARYSTATVLKSNREMTALGIAGLAISSATNLRTVLLSFRQRYEHYSGSEEEFDELLSSLVRTTENLRVCKKKLSNRPRDEDSGTVIRNLISANQNLLACQKVLDKLAKHQIQVHPDNHAFTLHACVGKLQAQTVFMES